MPCIATLGDDSFHGSLSDLFAQAAPGFGSCLTSTQAWEPTSCCTPHPAELFGDRVWDATDAPTASALDRGCRALLAAMPRRTDVTVGGQLQVSVAAWHWADPDKEAEPGLRPAQEGSALCTLVAPPGRSLHGALLLPGNHPIPWA